MEEDRYFKVTFEGNTSHFKFERSTKNITEVDVRSIPEGTPIELTRVSIKSSGDHTIFLRDRSELTTDRDFYTSIMKDQQIIAEVMNGPKIDDGAVQGKDNYNIDSSDFQQNIINVRDNLLADGEFSTRDLTILASTKLAFDGDLNLEESKEQADDILNEKAAVQVLLDAGVDEIRNSEGNYTVHAVTGEVKFDKGR